MNEIAFRERSRRSQLIRLRVLAEETLRIYGMAGAQLKPIQHWNNTTYRVDFGQQRFVCGYTGPGKATAV